MGIMAQACNNILIILEQTVLKAGTFFKINLKDLSCVFLFCFLSFLRHILSCACYKSTAITVKNSCEWSVDAAEGMKIWKS